MARHYGFMIAPAPPYSPEKKGKVEKSVKYLKSSVLKARVGEDAMVVQPLLEEFVDQDANMCTLATTHRVPAEVGDGARMLPATARRALRAGCLANGES